MNDQFLAAMNTKLDRIDGTVHQTAVDVAGLAQRADTTLGDHDRRITNLEEIEVGKLAERLDALERRQWMFAGGSLALMTVLSIVVQLAPFVLGLK